MKVKDFLEINDIKDILISLGFSALIGQQQQHPIFEVIDITTPMARTTGKRKVRLLAIRFTFCFVVVDGSNSTPQKQMLCNIIAAIEHKGGFINCLLDSIEIPCDEFDKEIFKQECKEIIEEQILGYNDKLYNLLVDGVKAVRQQRNIMRGIK